MTFYNDRRANMSGRFNNQTCTEEKSPQNTKTKITEFEELYNSTIIVEKFNIPLSVIHEKMTENHQGYRKLE